MNSKRVVLFVTLVSALSSFSPGLLAADKPAKKAAETALDKENIPAAYKEQVKEYFDSIRP